MPAASEHRDSNSSQGRALERARPAQERFGELGGWPGILGRLFTGEDLGEQDASAAFEEILAGRAAPSQTAAFAAALRTKGESVAELTGFVAAMRAYGEDVPIDAPDAIDTCGTGGDGSGTINVSTLAALVAVAGGATVCKHGGRAASSLAGSADVLESLGVVVGLGPEGVARCVREAGIGFCLATRFHPAMRHAAPVRRELGVTTVFNVLGPLVNPGRVRRQVVGVGDVSMAERMLRVLESNGAVHVMVVHGRDGIDELSTTAPTDVLELVVDESGEVERRCYVVDPRELGLAPSDVASLRGGDPSENAERARAVLTGAAGPQRDVVALNAAAAFVVAGIVADLAAGLELAVSVLESGEAERVLARLVRVSGEASLAGLC